MEAFLIIGDFLGRVGGNRCFKHMHKHAISASKTCLPGLKMGHSK